MFWKPVQKKKAITNKEFSKLLAFVLKGNSTTTKKLADLSFALQVSLMFCLFARFEESVVLKIDSLEEYGSDLRVKGRKL